MLLFQLAWGFVPSNAKLSAPHGDAHCQIPCCCCGCHGSLYSAVFHTFKTSQSVNHVRLSPARPRAQDERRAVLWFVEDGDTPTRKPVDACAFQEAAGDQVERVWLVFLLVQLLYVRSLFGFPDLVHPCTKIRSCTTWSRKSEHNSGERENVLREQRFQWNHSIHCGRFRRTPSCQRDCIDLHAESALLLLDYKPPRVGFVCHGVNFHAPVPHPRHRSQVTPRGLLADGNLCNLPGISEFYSLSTNIWLFRFVRDHVLWSVYNDGQGDDCVFLVPSRIFHGFLHPL